MNHNLRCKICSYTAKPIDDIKLKKVFLYCSNCGYIFLKDEFFVAESKERKRYLEHNNSLKNINYVNYLKDFIRQCITPYQKNIHSALDFGSGPEPVLAHLLEKKKFDVKIYDKFFYQNSAYKNYKYELITLTEVIEHVPDPVALIKDLSGLLNFCGYIAIMTLFHPDNEVIFLKWWYKQDITHVSFFTLNTFRYICSLTGLKIVYCNNINMIVLFKEA